MGGKPVRDQIPVAAFVTSSSLVSDSCCKCSILILRKKNPSFFMFLLLKIEIVEN